METKNKRFPAYGKKLIELRRAGKVPSRRVMIVFDWKLARTYPRIVIANDIPLDGLEFSYLAGLPVQIVYRGKDAHRVNAVSGEIMKVNPSWLATFAMDLVATDVPAFTIIHDSLHVRIEEAA